ncbi:hypothetical protein K1719_034635 [Acacia pycnantha]|nr:hypothetical protein K1719_034635 [Acacia pycnantha]
MASEAPRKTLSSGDKEITSSHDNGGAQEPLLHEIHGPENYSVYAAILPFLFPALGGLLYGYDIGATSCATMSIQSPTLSGTSWYNLTFVEIGLFTSGSLYGALIGSVLAFNVADFLGRRRELIVAASLFLAGALITALAVGFPTIVLGRCVYGMGIGLAMHAAPIYISETAPTQIRGLLVSLKEFFIVLGMIVGFGVGSILVDIVSGWRYMYVACTPLAVIMGIGICWLPYSPRWLLLRAIQGKGNVQNLREAAILCLRRLRGPAIGDSAPLQVDEIMGLLLFQQITGQPSVLYYAASILQSAGFSTAHDATRVSVLLALLKLIMTAAAVVVVDSLGRRPLLLGGVSGMVIALFLLGSYYLFLNDALIIAIVGLLLYVGCYQISFGPIGWLMISEVFPLRLRGRGLSIAILVNFGANALVTFAFSPLKELLGAGMLFYIFFVIGLCSLVFIYFVVPETKGLTLEEIEAKCL